jgi:hypothetical protein
LCRDCACIFATATLEWPAIQKLLRFIDRRTSKGERDYAILHLMAHYGLRPSEIVSLRLDSISCAAPNSTSSGFDLTVAFASPYAFNFNIAAFHHESVRPVNLTHLDAIVN